MRAGGQPSVRSAFPLRCRVSLLDLLLVFIPLMGDYITALSAWWNQGNHDRCAGGGHVQQCPKLGAGVGHSGDTHRIHLGNRRLLFGFIGWIIQSIIRSRRRSTLRVRGEYRRR